ncbi:MULTISPECIES: hypothetical protein [unclassified Streptomyces]|uniref:hypothetical protein n=1 Tax=unclassified Streptomyces TaxID=2593676 RepID=UPI0022715168|nr:MULTISPECIES: hypothetical protein [unclassified Streptomyces]MCY0920915.1 hypothetical protein [Streptomyces sp. H27-G5]MCY0958061.1 hypothetical protein [Streptomyces sp. H27-H5]
MSASPRITARHLVPCVAVLIASMMCGGCAGQEKARAGATDAHPAGAATAAEPSTPTAPAPSATPASPTPSSTARPASLDQIAAALDCRPEITVDAEELKEGACGAGKEGFRMATFAADQGQRAWLDESRMYGGVYLVGERWVVTAASAEALAPLRERLGGTVETGSGHGASHGTEHGASQGPSQGAEHPPGHEAMSGAGS